jgi:hypothetical protein
MKISQLKKKVMGLIIPHYRLGINVIINRQSQRFVAGTG